MSAFTLKALNGANPLALLAALGALRLASLRWPLEEITLSWQSAVPILAGAPVSSEQSLCAELIDAPAAPAAMFTAALGKNITVQAEEFRTFAASARAQSSREDRRLADFAAAFGCEDCADDKNGRVRYTKLCFITGSGHQDFLGTISSLVQETTADHIYEALFGGWQANNKGLAFRWDPLDAREYALRWGDPSKEGAWSTWGAGRLAFEALPFFPAQPQQNLLLTTGFTSRRRPGEGRIDEFTWPLWAHPLTSDEIRSLLAWTELQEELPHRETVRARGVTEVFRATRVRIGQGANFKVSFRPPRAI